MDYDKSKRGISEDYDTVGIFEKYAFEAKLF